MGPPKCGARAIARFPPPPLKPALPIRIIEKMSFKVKAASPSFRAPLALSVGRDARIIAAVNVRAAGNRFL